MAVQVNNLTKIYGAQRAVDDISFSAQAGEILAFLGPNGAGKSTTMKMLTCFMPPTSGSATVCGFDIATQSLDVRKCIGYLPEHNPLYKEMYVHEYLRFVARIRKMQQPQKEIPRAIEATGLGREQHKQIGQLSKGYRQRVGLAAAILHDPKVLILDEPTSGLDPNQLVEIRELIKTLGRDKTVIFSSHILAEVEQLCDRVVIIAQGKIVANDTLSNLRLHSPSETVLTVAFQTHVALNLLQSIAGVHRVEAGGLNQYRLFSDKDVRPALSVLANKEKLTLLEMRLEEKRTEDIFRGLTQSASKQ